MNGLGGKVKEKVKLAQIEAGKAKIKFYDISTSKYVTFHFKEISLEEWVNMECPNTHVASEEKFLFFSSYFAAAFAVCSNVCSLDQEKRNNN